MPRRNVLESSYVLRTLGSSRTLPSAGNPATNWRRSLRSFRVLGRHPVARRFRVPGRYPPGFVGVRRTLVLRRRRIRKRRRHVVVVELVSGPRRSALSHRRSRRLNSQEVAPIGRRLQCLQFQENNRQWRKSVVKYGGQGQSVQTIKLFQFGQTNVAYTSGLSREQKPRKTKD